MQYCISRHQSSNYINVTKVWCEQWLVLHLLRIREHICSLKKHRKTTFPNISCMYPMTIFWKSFPEFVWVKGIVSNQQKWTLCPWTPVVQVWVYSFKTLSLLHSIETSDNPKGAVMTSWNDAGLMFLWLWCLCNSYYCNLPALYMDQSWTICLMCTFSKLWLIM